MLRISNIKFPLHEELNNSALLKKAAKILKVKVDEILSVKLAKKSIDARERLGGFYVLALDVEILKEDRFLDLKDVSKVQNFSYNLPKSSLKSRPIIVGFGPAGMMCALFLAKAGARPIVIERGKSVHQRAKDINLFWEEGKLDLNSNVQYGEGGAGTFSDGKLTTGIKDFRCRLLLEEFVKAGAPEEILYLAKPHIGTDRLIPMVENIRNQILSLGGEVLFEHKLTDIITKDNSVIAIKVKSKETFEIPTENLVLAIGHSARDTFEMIHKKGHPILQKPFAVGVRIEHKQSLINNHQYGKFACFLPPADYKMAIHLPNKRSAYTFCMCPGGYVVAAASEKGRLVTNGMSYFSRGGENANSALLIGVYPQDFGTEDVLAGVRFQRMLEESAFKEGGGNYFAPVQKIGDFLQGIASTEIKNITPTYKPGVTPADFKNIFPEYIYTSLQLGIKEMDKKIKGFADENGIITAVESRSSSPIRILRDDNFESTLFKGLYPCGEGCGYAGGIVSAGVDGIRCCEAILKK